MKEGPMETVTTPRLVTLAQAAERLGLSRSKLYEILAAGELASVRIGRTRRIDVDDLAECVVRHRQEALE
jgi:excisionase family DNA binding protein